MKSIITISLFVIMLFVSGLAFAAVDQQCASCKVCSQNPQITTNIAMHRVFAGPKVGWINIPAAETTLLCQGCR
ncbi:MAG: hypothetical protein WAN11_10735 [Syntrophobacteraceae bacterium]